MMDDKSLAELLKQQPFGVRISISELEKQAAKSEGSGAIDHDARDAWHQLRAENAALRAAVEAADEHITRLENALTQARAAGYLVGKGQEDGE